MTLIRGFSSTTRVTPGGVGGTWGDIGSTRPAASAPADTAADADAGTARRGRGGADAVPDAVTPAAVVGSAVSSVARSISVAACCTFSSVEGSADGPGFCSARRSFCATSGRVSIKASVSSLTDQPMVPRPARMAVSSSPAAAARGRRQRSSRSTAGENA